MPLSDQLRGYAEAKILRLDRHFDRILDATMDISAASNPPIAAERVAELRLHLGTGALVKAKATARDLRAALDRVIEKADEQLRRRKERLRDEKHVLPASKVPRP